MKDAENKNLVKASILLVSDTLCKNEYISPNIRLKHTRRFTHVTWTISPTHPQQIPCPQPRPRP